MMARLTVARKIAAKLPRARTADVLLVSQLHWAAVLRQAGFQKCEWTDLTKPVVAKVTEDDIIAITA